MFSTNCVEYCVIYQELPRVVYARTLVSKNMGYLSLSIDLLYIDFISSENDRQISDDHKCEQKSGQKRQQIVI